MALFDHVILPVAGKLLASLAYHSVWARESLRGSCRRRRRCSPLSSPVCSLASLLAVLAKSFLLVVLALRGLSRYPSLRHARRLPLFVIVVVVIGRHRRRLSVRLYGFDHRTALMQISGDV